jgi:hypothetical protein
VSGEIAAKYDQRKPSPFIPRLKPRGIPGYFFKNAADVYIDFLAMKEEMSGNASLPKLDPLEERMLMVIAQANWRQERLSVRDMMDKGEFGAPATMHTRLKAMQLKGWITLSDTDDARRKQVDLTLEALMHFDRVAKCLMQAASRARKLKNS